MILLQEDRANWKKIFLEKGELLFDEMLHRDEPARPVVLDIIGTVCEVEDYTKRILHSVKLESITSLAKQSGKTGRNACNALARLTLHARSHLGEIGATLWNAALTAERETRIAALRGIIKVPWDLATARSILQAQIETILLQFGESDDDLPYMLSLSLSTMIKTHQHDDDRNVIGDLIANVLKRWFDSLSVQDNVQAVLASAGVLRVDPDMGGAIISTSLDVVIDRIDTLIETSEFGKNDAKHEHVHVMIAVAEMFAQSANNKAIQKQMGTEDALAILGALLEMENPEIQVRTAVAFSKLGFGNREARAKILSFAGSKKLFECINAVLSRQAGSVREVEAFRYHWAVEALTFLTLFPEIKEQLVNKHRDVIKRVIELTESAQGTLYYGLITILQNISKYKERTSEEKELQDQLRRLNEMAMSGQKSLGDNVPQGPHPYEQDTFVEARCRVLVQLNVISALVMLAKRTAGASFANARESIAHVLHNLAWDQHNRGRIIQGGAVPVLLDLVHDNTTQGEHAASKALAKLAITTDPKLVFRNGSETSALRPLLNLLKLDEDPLAQFESMLALTNIASMGPEIVERIAISEDGKDLNNIEMLQTSNDTMMRRAGCELLCNLVMCDTMFEKYTSDESYLRKIKIWIVLAGSEDWQTVRACTGALAVLSQDAAIAKRIASKMKKLEHISDWLSLEQTEIHHRAAELLKNMVAADRTFAERVVNDSSFLQLLVALQAITGSKPAQALIVEALMTAVKFGLLQEGALKNLLHEAHVQAERLSNELREKHRKRREEIEAEKRAREAQHDDGDGNGDGDDGGPKIEEIS
jgi:hypothetical protein